MFPSFRILKAQTCLGRQIMKRTTPSVHSVVALITSFLLLVSLSLPVYGVGTVSLAPMRQEVSSSGNRISSDPVMFIENVGQFDAQARFQVRGTGPLIWLTQDGLWVSYLRGGSSAADMADTYAVNFRLTFVGANPRVRLQPFGRKNTLVSFFLGNDPARWRSAVPVWSGVRYVDLYPGIDLEVTSVSGRWTWRLVPRTPTADISRVRLRVEGADSVTWTGSGLRLDTEVGAFNLPGIEVDTEARLARPLVQGDANAGFEVAAPLARPRRQDIAPEGQGITNDLIYSTFLGGTNYEGKDGYGGLDVDADGNAYVVGDTMSNDFPTTPGVIKPHLANGFRDVFVAKLNPSGSSLVYATYLGSTNWDYGYDVAVDADGNAYVVGQTESRGFPTTPGALRTTFGGGSDDGFLAKLNPTGTALVYSTFLGSYGSEVAKRVAVDATRHAYVIGETSSADFPHTTGSFDSTYGGGEFIGDGFLVKLNPAGSALVYGTFLGGSKDETVYDLAVDSAGRAVVVGSTGSSDFPLKNAMDSSFGGNGDGFVVKLNPSGSDAIFSTFLGGNGDYDEPRSVALDASGNVYVTGWTDSTDFPVTTTLPHGFVVKYNPNGSAFLHSRVLPDDVGEVIAVDSAGRPYIAATTGITNTDTVVIRFDAAFSKAEYREVLGGQDTDEPTDATVDANGNFYVVGYTQSSDFPTTQGAFDTSLGGISDVFVAKVAVAAAVGTPTPTPTWTPTWTPTPLPCPDTYEPNNSPNVATRLTPGTPIQAYICSSTDLDWYYLMASSGQIIDVTLTNIPTGADYQLELYDAQVNQLAASYNLSNADEHIRYVAQAGGQYLVLVYSSTGSSTTQPYRLSVQLQMSTPTPTPTPSLTNKVYVPLLVKRKR